MNTNNIWVKYIPRINIFFLVISLIFVFGIDLLILISSQMSLLAFWIEMLFALVVFLAFFGLENLRLSKKFASSKSKLDIYLFLFILLKDVALFLNFIPFIQIIGMAALSFLGLPYLIIYYFLMRYRLKAVK